MWESAKKRSKDLFSFPSLRTAIIVVASLIALFISLRVYMNGWGIPILDLLFFAMTASISLLSILKSEEFLDERRTLWGLIFVLLPILLGSFLELLRLVNSLSAMTYTSVFIASLIGWGLTRSKRARLLPLALTAIYTAWLRTPVSLISSLTAMLSATILGSAVGSISKPMLGLGGFGTIRTLASTVLGGDMTELEELLEEKSVPSTASPAVFRFGEAVILAIDVHPGPFRMGSHDISARFVERFKEAGINLVFLRRACSHERNLPSSREADKLIGEAFHVLGTTKPCEITAPLVKRTENFEIIAQRFGDLILVSVSGWPMKSLEDLPRWLEDRLSCRSGRTVLLIDRHDSLERDWYGVITPGSELEKEVEMAAIGLIEEAKSLVGSSKVRVGSAWANPGWASVGRGGISIIAIEGEGWETVYVSIDGNNMVPGMVEKVRRRLGEGTILVMATTDTHETLSTKEPYKPVGVECEDEGCVERYADFVVKLIDEARSRARGYEPSCAQGEIPILIMGEDLMNRLDFLISTSRIARSLTALALLPQLVFLLAAALAG